MTVLGDRANGSGLNRLVDYDAAFGLTLIHEPSLPRTGHKTCCAALTNRALNGVKRVHRQAS
ncbi:hypothetical protein GCM10007887_07380 [Methylobacterium haplocladii]|uniref:Uncharacterized protein n=1 Tax=Methylobacterium haplocladii TaxID=1176176 RepID=A0A512IMP7_9HYPH|nr:hypothetical protein MHA02_13160 [Methylobacterium haplocladii]GJD85272.1 hypothetical protein HPGCJGGD_3159 [Methylobacterium haplocladii]GLS58082.1 hypothetical protein GCM10007887_07380 [Methylobacterium haplocladii]